MTRALLRPNQSPDTSPDPADLDPAPTPSRQDAYPTGKDARKTRHTRPGKGPRKKVATAGQTKRSRRRSAAATAPDAIAWRDAHTLARIHRAFQLHCQGYRTAPSAAQLGVTPKTVRTYLKPYREQIQDEHQLDRAYHLMRAIESQRAICAAAWDAYAREVQLQAEILAGQHDYVSRRRAIRPGTLGRPRKAAGSSTTAGPDSSHTPQKASSHAADDPDAQAAYEDAQGNASIVEAITRPRLPTQAARYLTTALAAQREIARLQRLYDAPPAEPQRVEIEIVHRPDGPENIPPPNVVEYLEALARGQEPPAPAAAWPAPAAPGAHAPAAAATFSAAAPAAAHATQTDAAADEDSQDQDHDDLDLLDPGDALPTVTRRAAGQCIASPAAPAALGLPSVPSASSVPSMPSASSVSSMVQPALPVSARRRPRTRRLPMKSARKMVARSRKAEINGNASRRSSTRQPASGLAARGSRSVHGTPLLARRGAGGEAPRAGGEASLRELTTAEVSRYYDGRVPSGKGPQRRSAVKDE